MKSSSIATALIALMFSSPAFCGFTIQTQHNDGRETSTKSVTYFDGKTQTFAEFEAGALQFAVVRTKCMMVLADLKKYIQDECTKLARDWKATMERMWAQYGAAATPQGMSSLAQQTGKISPKYVGKERVAGFLAECWQLDKFRKYCWSRELEKRVERESLSKIKTLASAFELTEKEMKDPAEEWLKKKEKETKGYLVKCEDWRQALGVPGVVLGMIPDAELDKMIREARDGGAQPGGYRVVKVDEKTMKIEIPRGYKKTTVAALMQEQMRGAAGGDMSTSDTQTGMGGDVNLQEILKQQGITDTAITTTTKKKKGGLFKKMKDLGKKAKDNLLNKTEE